MSKILCFFFYKWGKRNVMTYKATSTTGKGYRNKPVYGKACLRCGKVRIEK